MRDVGLRRSQWSRAAGYPVHTHAAVEVLGTLVGAGDDHSATAHPAGRPSRIAEHELVGRDVPGDYGARGNQAVLAEFVPAHDRGVRSDGSTTPHMGTAELPVAGRPGIQ